MVADDEDNTLRLYDGALSGAPVRTWDLDSALDADKEVDIEAGTRVGDTDEAHGGGYGFAAGTADGRIPKAVDGFSVEGLEFAPGSTTAAYIGFRAPLAPAVPGGKALIVPVTDMDKVVTGSHAVFGTPIELDLGGLSIRDIRKNAADQYLIVAGSWAADDNSDPYALYRWDGVAGHAPVKVLDLPTADSGGWEAVVAVPDLTAPGGRAQLVTDDGDADLYGDGTQAKDLTHPEWQKSRTTWFTSGAAAGPLLGRRQGLLKRTSGAAGSGPSSTGSGRPSSCRSKKAVT